MRLYVATHNLHKLREIGEILPSFEILADDPDGVEETAPDFVGNAVIKLRAIAARHPDDWCMADDSGLEVFALDGAPGVRSARYSEGDPDYAVTASVTRSDQNNRKLLAALAGVADRRAQFTCAIALRGPDGREHVAVGHAPGCIAERASGAAGFGYDPLFIPDGYARSFAELTADEKNAISHRGRALAAARQIISGASAPESQE